MSASGKQIVGALGLACICAAIYTLFDERSEPTAAISTATHDPTPDTLAMKFSRERASLIANLKDAISHKEKRYNALGDAYEFIAIADAEFIQVYNQVKAIEDREIAVVVKKLDAEQKAAARKQGVSLGMTKEQVLGSSWGRPQSINTTTTATGTREQWVYGRRNYLYFEDGILTTVQN